MSDYNDKLNQLDDVAAYEAELDAGAEKEQEEQEERAEKAVQSRYPDKEREKKEKEKKKGKKEFFLKRFWKWLGRKTRDLIAELKKVAWPSFGKVMKQTSIVIGVLLFFLVIVFAIDLGLSQLYKILIDTVSPT